MILTIRAKSVLPAISLIGVILSILIEPLAAAEKEPIKIAATVALTGSFASIAQAEFRGLELAAEEINAAGGVRGRKIVLLPDDNQGDAKTAVSGLQRLLAVEKPVLIFSAFTHITQALAPIAAQSGSLLFYASTVREIAARNSSFFKDYIDVDESSRLLAQAAISMKKKRVALLLETRDSTDASAKVITRELSQAGVKVVGSEYYISSDTDLKPLLLKIKALRPDAIFSIAIVMPLVNLQLEQLQMLDIPTYQWFLPFVPATDTPKLRAIYEKNGAVSNWFAFNPDESNPRQAAFIRNFVKRYGEPPDANAAYTYDDMHLFSEAFAHCETQSAAAKCLAEYLKSARYDGVSGKLAFDSERCSLRTSKLIRVREGKWRSVSLEELAREEANKAH